MRLVRYRGRYYVAEQVNGTIRRTALRTGSLEVAKQRLEDYRKLQATKGDSVGEIVEAYLKERPSEGARFAWQAARDTFAGLRPDQIDREVCRKYADRRRRDGRKDGTIIKELGTVRAALSWAGKRALFEMPGTPPARDRHLSRSDFLRLVDACEGFHVRLFCELALATGARAGAVLDLTWSRVDFDRGLIRLAGMAQTNKRRATVPMTDRLRTALSEAKRIAMTDFVIEYRGARVRSVTKGFRAAARRAGLTGVTPHVLRHTAAVWMAEAGTPMVEIAEYLGHTDPKTTWRHYARFSPEYLRKAAGALEV